MKRKICVGPHFIGEEEKLTLISGPCVIESRAHTLLCAETLWKITHDLPVTLIFKASFDKANRSSIHSFRGPGLDKGLKILEEVKKEFGFAVVTDIHLPEQAKPAASICDMLQIPAFLCRQTDLLIAAAKTNTPLHIKKGQFLAPWDMKNVVNKPLSVGNHNLLLTDRGSCFGYNNLVSDFRSIPQLQKLGFPVCFDATHSVQLPGGLGDVTGGEKEFIPLLMRCAIAAGCEALFLETHPEPKKAKSDAASVLDLALLPNLLNEIIALYEVIQEAKKNAPKCASL